MPWTSSGSGREGERHQAIGIMTNVELLVRILEEAGVRWVFGIPSGPVLPLIDALNRSSIDYVLTANETSAGFMATTVGELTGTPGVCASTLGPGATNMATGVGCAWLDSAPLLAITCNAATRWLERRVQMRIDHHALFGPLTKATLPLRQKDFANVVQAALSMARAEPPGPVHLDLPEDVGLAPAGAGGVDSAPVMQVRDVIEGVAEALTQALQRSRRPLVVTGLSFTRSEGADHLLAFIEQQGIPFVSTLHAKGHLPESHANWGGVIGRARRTDVQAFVDGADLIVAVGYDPIEINYEEWVGSIPVFHLSTAPTEPEPGVKFEFNQGGDLACALAELAKIPSIPNHWTPDEWHVQRARLDNALRPAATGFSAHQVLDVLRAKLPPDGILAYDVGAHTHQIASQWRTDLPRTLLATNGWSSMGYGLPAAYAAKMVHPHRSVAAVVGDGCFQMTAGELTVAKRQHLVVPVIVLNDGWLGLMKVKQERKGHALSGVDLGSRTDAPQHYFGVPCRSARNLDELTAAIDWGFSLAGPSVIEAFIDVESYSLTVFD